MRPNSKNVGTARIRASRILQAMGAALLLTGILVVSAGPSWAQGDSGTACDAQTALVGLSFTSGDRTGPSLTKLAVRPGETVTASWSAWADGCEPKSTLAMHQSATRIFDPASMELLIDSNTCTGEDCRGADGRYTISIVTPAEGMCVAQIDLVLGDALPFVGPPRSYYSSILSQGPNRLISYSRALVNAGLCEPAADGSSRAIEAPAPAVQPAPAAQRVPADDASSRAISAQPAPAPAEEGPVVLGQVVTTTTPPVVPAAQPEPVDQIPVVEGEELAFTGPTAASRSAGISGSILILLGSALCVGGQRLKARQN